MNQDVRLVVAVFGAPGSGKGTQSGLLVERLGFKHFSVGDLLRAEVGKKSAVGEVAHSYMSAGKLVPDYVINDVIKAYFLGSEDKRVILDGFPRTKAQAEELSILLKMFYQFRFCAINIEVSEERLLSRISGRFMCGGCSTIFNTEDFPEGFECPKCGFTKKIMRNDDNKDTLTTRIVEYNENIKEIINFYKTDNSVYMVDGDASVEKVYEEIDGVIKKVLG